jgi:RNA polymerase sigma-70 factor (sigma-E family)
MRLPDVDHEPIDFDEFYRSARDGCFRAVLASVGNRAVAEDILAEAFARAWASWSKVSRHPAPRAWVLRTALNTRVSWWRRRWRETELPAGYETTIAGTVGEDLADPVVTEVMAALLRLPLRQRQVVGLRIFLDLDTSQTADVLSIAPGTVKAHLSRAIAALRQEFIAQGES